jgi:hypothetical protein
MTVPGLADARWFVQRCSRLDLARIEAGVCDPLSRRHVGRENSELGQDPQRTHRGDSADGGQPLEAARQLGAGVHDGERLRLQALHALREVLEMRLDVPRDRVRQLGAVTRCVKAIALLGARERQSPNAPHDRAQIEDLGCRWLPRLERHPAREREEHLGIDAVGL